MPSIASRVAIALKPTLAEAHHNLALLLALRGQTDQAIIEFQHALKIKANFPQAWEGLGRTQLDQRQFSTAAESFRRAISLRPTSELYTCLGLTSGATDQMDDALGAHQKAIELEPKRADAHLARGRVLRWCGWLDESIAAFRRAIALDPHHHIAHSELLYSLLFHEAITPKEAFAEHQRWAENHTAGIIPLPPPDNDRSPDRRLKIGYVSPNFRNQAVMSFVLPIIENRDARETEIFCYSDVTAPDQWTNRLRNSSDQWRDTAALTSEQLAHLVRQDKIDILIDLTGHIGGGRLQTFAYKPAPVQVSYIGYQATTGVSAIDYFLTDDWANPPGKSDCYFVEQLICLPESFFCYAPPPEAPPVGTLPAMANGHVTFGCLNNLAKVTQRTIALWSRVMNGIPNSRLMLLIPNGETIRQRLQTTFASAGVSPNRIELVHRVAPGEYLQRYNQIDIALDPVPFNGHTTTCDAAWMGCPTVTLSGTTYAHRYGGSLPRNLGLPELIAGSEEDYIRAAVTLASDLSHLAKLRLALREMMRHSIVTSGARFTRNLEIANRQMWQRWCESRG